VTEPPLPGELLSSWVFRLAWRNGIKAHTLTKRFWHHPGVPWGGDGDLRVGAEDLQRLAALARQPYVAVWETSLRSFEGSLFDGGVCNPAGILSLGGRGKNRTAHGLSICPQCLEEDSVPYFRRQWRVSYLVTCVKHQRLLLDTCPGCGGCIVQVSRDEGSIRLNEDHRATHCLRCGYDWQRAGKRLAERPLEDGFWVLQAQFESALSCAWTLDPTGRPVMSMSLFKGLRYLLRALIGRNRMLNLAAVVAPQLGLLPLAPTGEYPASE